MLYDLISTPQDVSGIFFREIGLLFTIKLEKPVVILDISLRNLGDMLTSKYLTA